MGWIWPVLAFTIVLAIIVVSLRLSTRRSPDMPETKGDAGGPPYAHLFGFLTPSRRRYGTGRR